MAFEHNLRKLREQKGWTQHELASRLGVSTNTVVSYEKGQKKPAFDTLVALSGVFDISLDALCETERPLKTWADAMRCVNSLLNIPGFVRFFEMPTVLGNENIKTPSLVFHRWVADKGNGSFWYTDTSEVADIVPYTVHENPLSGFLAQSSKMLGLLRAGEVDEDLYQIWLDKIAAKHDVGIPEMEGF